MKTNTVFVLLAGGKSERMGTDKGLLKFNDSYWIFEQLHRISKTSIQEVYIGLGFHSQHYFKAIPWFEKAITEYVKLKNLKVKVIVNSTPEFGSFSTLQAVLKNISKNSNIILNHIDIPILNAKELNKIIEINNEIVIPNYKGKNGHPIKLSANIWHSLLDLDVKKADSRLDFQLKKINPIKISNVEVFDRAITLNLNSKKDWNSFLENQ